MRFFLILFLSLVSVSALAQEATQNVPRDFERDSQPDRYKSIPGFPNGQLEFIRDGNTNYPLMRAYLSPNTITYISRLDLHWLTVTDVSYDSQGIGEDGSIPVIAGVRWHKNGWLPYNGTINGLFRLNANGNGTLKITMIKVSNNQQSEDIVVGAAFGSQDDILAFVNAVAGQTLRTFFSIPVNTQNLIQAAKP